MAHPVDRQITGLLGCKHGHKCAGSQADRALVTEQACNAQARDGGCDGHPVSITAKKAVMACCQSARTPAWLMSMVGIQAPGLLRSLQHSVPVPGGSQAARAGSQ